MSAREPDFFLHSGDTIYADGPITGDVLLPDGLLICLPSAAAADAMTAARERGMRATGMMVEPDGDGLDDLARLVEQRHLRVIVAETFPLERASVAHRAGELGRTTGKLVLTT